MFKKIFTPVSWSAVIINFFVLLSSVGLLIIHREKLPPVIPLWFTKPWGSERLADPNYLWLFPLLIFTFLFINNLIGKILLRRQKILALILVWSALFVSLILFFPLYRILLIVI